MHITLDVNATTVSPTSSPAPIAFLCSDPLRLSSQSDNNSENFVALVYPSLSLDCEQSLNSSAINSIAPAFPSELRTTATIVCALVMTLGIVGNVLVPLVVCRTKDMCNSTNLFLINLSIADLLVIVVCMPTVLIELHSRPEVWILGEVMCKAVPFVELVVAHGSILTMLAISFERYYAICKPLKAGYKCTIRRALVIIVIVWSVAFVATIPVLFGTELSQARYIDGSLVSVCLTKANTDWQKIYFLGSMTAFFWGPLCVLLVIYSMITKRLVVDDRIQSNTDGRVISNADNVQMRARRQVVLMLAAVVASFFICLLPFRLLTLWLIIASEDQIKQLSMEVFYNLLYFCRILLYVNSMLNPCLYAVVSSKFREAFVVVLCCRNRNRSLIRHSTFNTTTSSVATTASKSSLHRTTNGKNGTNCTPLPLINASNHNNNSETPLMCTSLKNPLFEPRICDIKDPNLNSFLRELNENDIRIKCQRFDSPYTLLRDMSTHESYV